MLQIKSYYTGSVIMELDVDDLRDANLVDADLEDADLRGAILRSTNLTGANLTGANLEKKHCYVSITPIGSENGQLWTMKNSDGVLIYNRGCFSGTKEEFLKAVDNKHFGTKYHDIYYKTVDYIEMLLGENLNNE